MSEQPVVLHVRPERVADGVQSLSLESEMGLSVTAVTSREAALETLSTIDPDYLVCEHAPEDGLDGLGVLDTIGGVRPGLPVLLCTEEPDGQVAAEATRRGVAEYVPRSETDPANRVRTLAAADESITATTAPEHAVESTTESLRELTRLAADEDRTETETIEGVLRLGAERLDLSLGYLGRIEGDTYEIEHLVGDHAFIRTGASTPLSATYCEHTAKSNTLFPIHDAAVGWGDHPAYQVGGIACYLGGRVSVNGETYGTVCFADEEPRAEPFTDAERAFVELLIQWVSDELERRRRETELERYEDIIEAVDDGVYALDSEGNFLFVNEAMTALTGYEAETLLGSHTGTIKSPAVVEKAEGIVREMIFEDRDEEETFDLSIQRAESENFPAEDHMTVLWDDDGRFEGTAGVIRDITERKERELELREANRRIEQILGRIGAAFFAVDDDWNLTYWNAQAEAVLGRDAEAVMGENFWKMFPDATDSAFFESYREAMRSQEPVVFEEYYPPAEKWFRVNAYPSTDGLSVYFHDITDQKERDRKLSGLLETTRSLMHAHTETEVAETVVEAAESELGFDLNLVRLYDDEAETLYPVASTDGMPDRPIYDADEAFPGGAFQRGEIVRVDDFDHVDNYDDRNANAAMYVPIGDHGVLSVATTEEAAFDEADVSVAEILASNAAAALSRVEREDDLRRYEAVVENVRDMVYVLDEDGTFQLATEPLAEWLGFEREAMLGEHPSDFLDQQDVATFDRHIREMQADSGETSRQLETSLVTADGAERPAEVEVSLIDHDQFRGTVGVVRDRTELVEAREDLRDERDRFSYLFNNLPDAVAETEVSDDQPLVRSVNPAFTEVFGLDHTAVLDESLDELVQPPTETASDEASRLTDFDGDEAVRTAEIRRRTADGFRDFLFRGIPYRRDDRRVWGFCIYTDITDQKERERRLEVLNRVLRHNLRNDLTVVMGFADELATRLTDEDHLSLLDRLQQKAADVAALSDRAREIERSIRRDDAGNKPVPVVDAVTSLVDTYERNHGVTVEMDVPETDARTADGRFTRVVEELLNNSVEHAGSDPALSIDIATTEQRVTVTVADDGPGIPAHELDVLTGEEPITQLSHSSGLGLWLVVWMTESYGGTVTFDGTDETGTVVTLTLPRADD
ncbi:PAS domain S-box protein [Haloarcula amylovorans]|uniref:PAS domain S-box protein n=1 Tax=Haloarcula amylovorans TaxID=2562280 RepID=UPI00107678C0|nr:PAS domain S-box protein [Halomicroarcula amylolytica]